MLSILLQPLIFLTILVSISPILGEYIAKVASGEKTILSFVLLPIEKLIYKITKTNTEEQTWQKYAFSLVSFSILGIVFLFALQILQGFLPLNPEYFHRVRWDSALNTAISFVANTNWQNYSGEKTMSYLTQMLGLSVQNFLSAAVGLCAFFALSRAFGQQMKSTLGNFWVDVTRGTLYILLPFAILYSAIFVSEGIVQNLNPYTHLKTIEGQQQTIAQGPAASQTAIKILGTNGGGFFGANSAHPFENPTPLCDYLQILGLLLIPASLPFAFGFLVKNPRQGLSIFATMLILFALGAYLALKFEYKEIPILSTLGVSQGLNMEGKEIRSGILGSVFFAQSTTATSCGATNSMQDSFTPLSGMVLMFNMMIGEAIFGGVGVGMVAMILYAVLTIFLVGLMIGRTPEIFGKRLAPFEMIMAVIALVVPSIVQLIFSALAISTQHGLVGIHNPGAHGLSEIIYAFASAAGNNGSAFAGLGANTLFYNLAIGFTILVGRFATIIPALAIAGSLSEKKFVPKEAKFPTEKPLFVFVLTGVVIIVGALTFFPVWVLGPIIEHLSMVAGKLF